MSGLIISYYLDKITLLSYSLSKEAQWEQLWYTLCVWFCCFIFSVIGPYCIKNDFSIPFYSFYIFFVYCLFIFRLKKIKRKPSSLPTFTIHLGLFFVNTHIQEHLHEHHKHIYTHLHENKHINIHSRKQTTLYHYRPLPPPPSLFDAFTSYGNQHTPKDLKIDTNTCVYMEIDIIHTHGNRHKHTHLEIDIHKLDMEIVAYTDKTWKSTYTYKFSDLKINKHTPINLQSYNDDN